MAPMPTAATAATPAAAMPALTALIGSPVEELLGLLSADVCSDTAGTGSATVVVDVGGSVVSIIVVIPISIKSSFGPVVKAA